MKITLTDEFGASASYKLNVKLKLDTIQQENTTNTSKIADMLRNDDEKYVIDSSDFASNITDSSLIA